VSGNPVGHSSWHCVQETESLVAPDDPAAQSRTINPLAALTLVLVFPGKTFRRLVDRPHWALPLAFVVVAVMLNRLLALSGGLMDELLRSEAFLSGAALSEARSAALSFAVISSIVAIPVVTLVQTLLFIMAGKAFGGRTRSRVAFSAVCHASVPIGLSALAFAALMPVTHAANAAANLSFLVDPSVHPFIWSLLVELDLSAIWFFVLLGIAAEPVFSLPRRRARVVVAAFAVAYVLVMSLAGMGSASRTVDRYAGWKTRETGSVVLHSESGISGGDLDDVAEACGRAADRARELTGLDLAGAARAEEGAGAEQGAGAAQAARIECYVYPSLEEKLRVTGNAATAHRVEWANAVHLAWVAGAEASLTRDMLKLAGANAYGKVYTPVIRDGLAVLAGGSWGGLPVRDAARDLLGRHVLPDLDTLVDPISFARLDERLSQPAAGAFMAFVLHERGYEAVQRLYAESFRQPSSASALLEETLGDSLGSIEARWLEFLESDTGATEARASVER
jgi:hypothetical protein